MNKNDSSLSQTTNSSMSSLDWATIKSDIDSEELIQKDCMADQLQKQGMIDQQTIEKPDNESKNQQIEMKQMNQHIKQLLVDTENLQGKLRKCQEEHAAETVKFGEEFSNLEAKNENLVNENKALRIEVASQEQKIKSLHQECEELRTQVGNSVDKSIATDLVKLIEEKLGVTVQTNQVAELTKKISDIKECRICCHYYDHNDRKPVTTKCGHVNCKSCMTSLANTSQKCPDCRAKFRKEDLIPLNLSFDDL